MKKILLECTDKQAEYIIEAIEGEGCNTYAVVDTVEDYVNFNK